MPDSTTPDSTMHDATIPDEPPRDPRMPADFAAMMVTVDKPVA